MLIAVCSSLLPYGAAAADDASLRAVVDAAVVPLMAEHAVPGMAVAVSVDGQTWFYNYGLASRETQTPVSQDTLFELGSISKTFTATLATYAQGQGALSLEDHPGKYLAQIKGSALDQARLFELGAYAAGGLPLQMPETVSDLPQAMAYFSTWKPHAAPGTVRRYSNPSIGLFGHIAALALKTDFAQAMEGIVFPQLGLRHTYVNVPPGAQAHYAWGHRDGKPVRVGPGVFAAEAYGVKSSSADMIRYLQANIDPARLLGPMARAVAATHLGYFDMGPMVQGLGWEQYPYPVTLTRLLEGNGEAMLRQANAAKALVPARPPVEPALFNKTGSTGGFGAYVLFVPQKKLGIVMLANKNYPIPARVKAAYAILEQAARMVQ
nr:class C beta-lactamase [Massilia sp. H6]